MRNDMKKLIRNYKEPKMSKKDALLIALISIFTLVTVGFFLTAPLISGWGSPVLELFIFPVITSIIMIILVVIYTFTGND